MQYSELAQGHVHPESKARPTWISKKQTESPRVSASFKGIQEFQEGKTDDLCTDTLHLWVVGRWSDSQRLRVHFQALPGSAHQRDCRNFRRNSHQSRRIDQHQGNEKERKKIPLRNNKQNQRTKGRVPGRNNKNFLPKVKCVWKSLFHSESWCLYYSGESSRKSDNSLLRKSHMHEAASAERRASPVTELFFFLLAALGLRCGAWASHCGGFSCCRVQAPGTWASVVAARGLSSCGSRGLECRLSSCGTRAQRHVGSPQTRDRTCVPCIGRWILHHCATREVPITELLTSLVCCPPPSLA